MINLNLLNYLKKKRSQLSCIEQSNDNIKTYNMDNIEIVIENNHHLVENEDEILKQGALLLLDSGKVDSVEEGIIACATMLRGLKYRKTDRDENGKVKIILRDVAYKKVMTK